MPVHLLSLQDFTKVEIVGLIERAIELKNQQDTGIVHQQLAGKTIGFIFENPAIRSRVSFEAATYRLGGQVIYLAGPDAQPLNSEPLKDLSRVLSSYVDGMVVGASSHEMVTELAHYSSVPVINCLSDLHHPCQILGDVMTVVEKKGAIEDLHIGWLGNGNSIANSWIQAAAKIGFELTLACPEEFKPDAEILAVSRREASRPITLVKDPEEVVRSADVINVSSWPSAEQEIFLPYQLDVELFGKAPVNCIVLHSLPANRGEEITDEVLESGQCAAFAQAGNIMHINKAILESFIF